EAGNVNRLLHSRDLGRQLREVRPSLSCGVEMYRQGDLVGDLPDRIPLGIPKRRDVVGVGDLETAHTTALDHAPHLFHSSFNRRVGNASETRVAVGVRAAEASEPLVVDSDELNGGPSVIQPTGGAQDSVEYLGLHAVAFLVLQAQLRVGEPSDA